MKNMKATSLVIGLLGLILAAPSVADGAHMAQALQVCAKIERDLDRLDCYDRLAKQTPKTLTATPAPSTPTRDHKRDLVVSGEQAFGMERQLEQQTPDEITSRIIGEFHGWNGKTIFRLENGQVWQQSNSGRVVYHANNPKVTIKKGFFGSYRLYVEGLNASVAVRRIK